MKILSLFTIGCDPCVKLENLLKDEGFGFIVEHDMTEVIEKGFEVAPVLKVEDRETAEINYYGYRDAVKLIKGGQLKNGHQD